MRRIFWNTLTNWKELDKRKPLLLQGARQVGKTWLLKAFGAALFERTVLLDFAEDPSLNAFFKANLKPDRILTDLSVYLGEDIELENTLLIFDEVQGCPEAITSLKYFYEAYPKAFICASGSLLGLGLSEQNFPVGKVQREWLRPMCFSEFLEALGESRLTASLQSAASDRTPIVPPIHEKAFSLFREYMITGGMPEVVQEYVSRRNTRAAAFKAVRSLQQQLTASYLDDIAKHAGSLKAMRIAALFRNIPEQLAKETRGIRKFMFKDVIPGRSTYDVLEGPIEWLIRAGLIHKVPICRTIKHPQAAYSDSNSFMLYLFDVGILGSMLNLDPATLYQYQFGQFKGFLAENAVLNEISRSDNRPVYTWRNNTSEIEFLLEREGCAIPVEVKSGLNTKAKSMRVFRDKYAPELAILLSAAGVNQFDDGLLHSPLYLSGMLEL